MTLEELIVTPQEEASGSADIYTDLKQMLLEAMISLREIDAAKIDAFRLEYLDRTSGVISAVERFATSSKIGKACNLIIYAIEALDEAIDYLNEQQETL